MFTWFRNVYSSVVTVLQGMYVTLITMLKTFRRKRQSFTDIYAYPEVPIKVKPRYRGFHRFDLTNLHRLREVCPGLPGRLHLHRKGEEPGRKGLSHRRFCG